MEVEAIMRRCMLILILVLPVAGVFGLDVGFGASGGYVLNEMSTSLSSAAVSSRTQDTHVPFGASVYADIGIIQVSIGYTQFTLSRVLSTLSAAGTTTTLIDIPTGTGGYVSFALLGKYPFVLGAFTLSPLLGLEMDFNVILLDAAGNDLRAAMTNELKNGQNQVWLKAGAAFDMPLSERAYLRSEALFSYKLPNSKEQSDLLAAQHAGFDVLLFAIRPEIDLFVGFKL